MNICSRYRENSQLQFKCLQCRTCFMIKEDSFKKDYRHQKTIQKMTLEQKYNLMNHSHKLNKIKHEDIIKNRLVLIDSEETQFVNYRPFYETTRNHFPKPGKQQELTDWANNPNKWQIDQQENPQSEEIPPPQKERQRSSLLSHIRYQPSSQSHDKQKTKRLQLNPVVVKFNANVLSMNLEKSKDIFLRKIKEDPYLTHYSSSNMVFDRKSRKQSTERYKDLYLPFMNLETYRSDSLPKTERLSGILRLMKKREPVRMRRKRNINNEDLVAIRIQ